MGHQSLAHCCHLVDHLDALPGRRDEPRPSVEEDTSYKNLSFIHGLLKAQQIFRVIREQLPGKTRKKLTNKGKFHKLFMKCHSLRVNSLFPFIPFLFYFYYHIIIVLGAHCDIYKSAYNIS
jgi:hypothetical protein